MRGLSIDNGIGIINMKLIMEGWRQFINESGLSRVRKHIMNHDCAILTAFRGDLMDMGNCTDNAEMPEEGEKNMNRNRDLKATLLGSGYGVTKVDGSYVEDFDTPKAMEVKENSLFCVNLKDDPSFIRYIGREVLSRLSVDYSKGRQGVLSLRH